MSAGLGVAIANALNLAVPALDTGRAIDASYERFLPAHEATLAGALELRQAATGDYSGYRVGGAIEVRWYRHHMRGWFVGGGMSVASDVTHDHGDGRWIDPTLELGITARGGYRAVVWRNLIVTTSSGLAAHRDIDVSGRLPSWVRGGVIFGLDVGWLF